MCGIVIGQMRHNRQIVFVKYVLFYHNNLAANGFLCRSSNKIYLHGQFRVCLLQGKCSQDADPTAYRVAASMPHTRQCVILTHYGSFWIEIPGNTFSLRLKRMGDSAGRLYFIAMFLQKINDKGTAFF